METIFSLDAAVRERVILPGYIDEKDKAALLSGAEALVFPSLYEGFGFPVLEAQSCGIPVLASTSSSLPEITNGSALLVDPLDTNAITQGIQRIVDDDTLRRELISKGAQNINRFSWEKTAGEVIRILETVGSK